MVGVGLEVSGGSPGQTWTEGVAKDRSTLLADGLSPSNLFPRCTAARFVFVVVEQTVDAAGLTPLPHSGEEPGKSRLIGTPLIPSPTQFN